MPAFWLGLLILMAFVQYFGTIPIYTDPPQELLERRCWLFSMPAAAVGFRSSALIMRLTRSSMLEVLRQDYIRTARAKGASDTQRQLHHALRNAVLPVVTVIGIEAAFLMGGLIVTETVFNIPGVARFLVEAIRWRDYPIVQNLVMFIAFVAVIDQFPGRHALRGARSAHQIFGKRRRMDIYGRASIWPRTRADVARAESVWSTDPLSRRRASARRGRRRHHARCSCSPRFSPTVITPYDPISDQRARSRWRRPSHAHLLGADFMGRDIYSRIVYGARISLAVGLGSTVLGCVFGIMLGLTSGYLGGWVDLVIQRLVDMLQALPLLVLALVMAAALGPSLDNTIIAIAIPLIPYTARVIRSNTLALREQPFVEAARAVGMSEFRIAVRHVLPNTLAPLIVLATAQLGSAILTEASLSFLGLGVPEPHPSWGRMLSESAAEYVRTAPWLVIFPGLAISLAVFGTNLFGDALRDILDPRLRN